MSNSGDGADRRRENPPKWADVTADKNLIVKGAPLEFVHPLLKEGKKVAKLNQAEVDKLSKASSTVVILYVVGQTPSRGDLTRYIEQQWNHVGKPKVLIHDKGYFIVKFVSLDDRNELLYAGPHMINSRPMVIKAWTPDFDLQAEVLRVITL